jgi:lipopolysaccharide export system permease protein
MCAVLLLLAVPLGFVNPRVGRSANLIIALLMVMVYLNMINIVQASIVQSKIGLAYGWWPVHFGAILLVVFLFSWRLKINSRMHPLVLWSNLKCSLRGKDKSSS